MSRTLAPTKKDNRNMRQLIAAFQNSESVRYVDGSRLYITTPVYLPPF